jgi:SAM-dependent methyltransferase
MNIFCPFYNWFFSRALSVANTAPAGGVERFLTAVSRVPRLWNVLRWIAEAGYFEHYAVIDRELAPWRDAERRFLDLGCGTGQHARCFPPPRYVGIDPTRPYVEYAAAHRPGSFAVMNGNQLGVGAARFDGALVLGVFHHLSDDLVRACMDELRLALAAGGTLLVIEDIPPPSAWNVPGHIMHWLDRGEHIRSDEDYRALFAPHFRVERSYTMRSGICDYQVYVLAHEASAT